MGSTSKFQWRQVSQTTVRAFTLVLLSPRFDLFLGIGDIREPVGIQALVPQTPIEAFHAAALHGPAGLNVNQPDLAILAPSQKMATGKLGSVIASHSLGRAALLNNPFQRSRHASASLASAYRPGCLY